MDAVTKYSQKNCILHIDSDKAVKEALHRFFSAHYTYVEAETGAKGLEIIRALPDRIRAILFSATMSMEEDMVFLRTLQSEGLMEQIPVIMLTTLEQYGRLEECYKLGIADVIVKDLPSFVMLRRVESQIELFDARKSLSVMHKKGETEKQEISNVLLLMKAVQSVYDMIICVNLTKNSYYMIDYDRFLTHRAGYDGTFDDLIAFGASAVPEPHRTKFAQTFGRENLLKSHAAGKKSVSLIHPQLADDGVEHMVSTRVLFVEEPETGDLLEITLSRYIDDEWEEKRKNQQVLSDALIVAQQANRAKSDFLSRMSHDIRTPLNAIMGMATIIGADIKNSERIQDCVKKIGISSKYLLGLINDILDFSKIESGNLSINEADFNIRKMAEEIQTIVGSRAEDKKQTFTIEIEEDVDQIYRGDAFRIRQILINLLDNAYKYTPEGGTYSLHISVGNNTCERRFLKFRVQDNGMGINEQFMKRLFDPFTQVGANAEQNGVGLGLAITRNLVYLMNGHMDVDSQEGKGTTFVVELPLGTGVLPENPEQDARDTDNGLSVDFRSGYKGEKILVVEDNEFNQEVVKTILELENLQVDIAQNGQEAVEKFLQAQPGEYLVIFMDLSMPIMNGYEATECIRKSPHPEAQTIPIYALTANAFYSDVVEAQNSGMNGHISKPIDFKDVTKILNQIFEGKDSSRE